MKFSVLNSIRSMMNHARSSFFLLGLLSLFWFILKTGTKPSRISYPCQRAAMTSGSVWLTIYLLPLISTFSSQNLKNWRKHGLFFAFMTLILVTVAGFSLFSSTADMRTDSPGQAFGLSLAEIRSPISEASNIFVVNGTSGNDKGVKRLIELMNNHELPFYQLGVNQSSPGLIASDDIVLIKVNCQWDERGGTNTDLVKSLVQAIINHPMGFTGEVIIADNGQAQYGSTGHGGSLSYTKNNAEDITQSMQKVADSFPNHRISTYLWDDITSNRVDEYAQGSMDDGYTVGNAPDKDTGIVVSYPKFKTKYGTFVSFKMGIWNPDNKTYDSGKLKVINVPVLKSHGGYGVTASVKHYMGVTSDKLSRDSGGRAHISIRNGGMGTQMAETRLPALNILDAIWINANPGTGPSTSYNAATGTNIIASSIDPIALDYWAAKNILMPAANAKGYSDLSSLDPDNTEPGSFGDWLRLSKKEIMKAGHKANADIDAMNVYVSQNGTEGRVK